MSEQLDQVGLQRRVIKVLSAGQVLGGIGVAAGASVGSVLAADMAGDAFAGFASASSHLGGALIALPISRIMAERGRRVGLMLGYTLAVLACFLIVGGAELDVFPVTLAGLFLFGSAQTSGLQSRYAATDLARPQDRGRSLGTVVWATTIGSVLGPNVSGPMGDFAEMLHLPRLSGPYLMSLLVFLLAFSVISTFLRPDPLLVAQQLHTVRRNAPKAGYATAMRIIRDHPAAILGLASMVIGQMVMTSVMSMTPVHLDHQGATLQIIGFVISGHIGGMYVASPLVGWATDRYGRKLVIMAGASILLLSFLTAGSAPDGAHVQLGIGLFLLGLGWSCTLIGGSTLLTESVPFDDKPGVQGAADLTMGMAGACAGLISGVIVGIGSYTILTIVAAILVIPLVALIIRNPKRSLAGA